MSMKRGRARAGPDLEQARQLKEREDERFVRDRPRSMELIERARASMPLGVPMSWMDFLYDHPTIFVEDAEGSSFTDVDGHRYLDFFLGITVASAGHTNPAVIHAVDDRMHRGIQFQLPTPDAIVVAEALAERWGLPKWQFALSSSQSIIDVIRLARLQTGRDRVLTFEGKYHGHLSELLAIVDDQGNEVPEYKGISGQDISRTIVVDWNDLDAVERRLAAGDVALLIAEPALTNSGIVFPDPGFHEGLRTLTAAAGTLLLIDETQTLPCAFGGLTREWGLEKDFVVLGKSLGGGVPVSAYGMTDEVAGQIDREYAPYEVSGEAVDEPAVGGTMFGNALSMAATRAALEEVWIEPTFERTQGLAQVLADGFRSAFAARKLDWNVYQLGNRAGFRYFPDPPSNNTEAGERDIPLLRHALRVYLANRGIWDFGWWCGPAISAQASHEDVDRYLEVFHEFLGELSFTG
jgi:glutamate-1-semialdehyde aminotransferase